MILRTLSLLRSLQGASQTASQARGTVQQASDYRWLRHELRHGTLTHSDARLADGTPGVAITLAYPATTGRMAGGSWPVSPAARERCHVAGQHACRAAGAPAYRTLESLSRGLAEGGIAVLRDAARFQYLLDRDALGLAWCRPESLPKDLSARLAEPGVETGWLLLELRVPETTPPQRLSGTWLDTCLDRYRRILPRQH
ncbi:hypothetical protein [Halomonas marinisediminis]|uniref:Uncharacterized protein n=1 Tax=Halomonas marinisediminis TaxID=2546095 RepID=A0ABY2D3W0_9GAMM|nr:hypothetical protein [Halomonas marinisediminis]TDB00787.1 hypothetical protein E0702_14045 [Halomonas marinisediminis]